MDQLHNLKPIPFWMSLLFFGIPSAIGTTGLYVVLPILIEAGFPMLLIFILTVSGMFPLLLLAALIAYRLEGHSLSVIDIANRFRIKRLGKREWRTIGLLVVYVGGQLLLMPTARWLITGLPLPLPAMLPPAIDPRVANSIPTEFLGVVLRGNWGIAFLYLLILSFNIFGEEF